MDFFSADQISARLIMLNLNPGLRDITHSITGGSIAAQGKLSHPLFAKALSQWPLFNWAGFNLWQPLSLAAGYWMPFACAKAVCATFCYNIAGALIPIFGPTFPSECISPDAPGHGRMIISQDIISSSTKEAESYRRLYMIHNVTLPPTPSPSA